MNKKKLGVVIGRFQPMHVGHQAIIKKAIEECDEVLVLLGSSNKVRNFKNPLTNEQRITQIENVFGDAVIIGKLKDKPDDQQWLEEVIAHTLHFQENPDDVAFYCGEKDAAYYEENLVNDIVAVKTDSQIDATTVRALMYETDTVDHVPDENVVMLEDYLMSKEHISLTEEYYHCIDSRAKAQANHAFSNPIEPVAHAMIMQGPKVLLVKRGSIRGYNQWALPGGFVNEDESTKAGAIRETKEETGIDLLNVRGIEYVHAVEENLDDLGVRTLGVNYMFAVDPTEDLSTEVDGTEITDIKWVDLKDIVEETEELFYNHNLICQRLAHLASEKQLVQRTLDLNKTKG